MSNSCGKKVGLRGDQRDADLAFTYHLNNMNFTSEHMCSSPTAMLNQPGDTSGPNSGAQALAQLLQKDRFIERDVWWDRVGHDGQSLWPSLTRCWVSSSLLVAGRYTEQEYSNLQVLFLNKRNNSEKIFLSILDIGDMMKPSQARMGR